MQHSPEKAAKLQALREKMRAQFVAGESQRLDENLQPVKDEAPLLLTEADILRAMGCSTEIILEAEANADKAA